LTSFMVFSAMLKKKENHITYIINFI
jgi:hypothetical protein